MNRGMRWSAAAWFLAIAGSLVFAGCANSVPTSPTSTQAPEAPAVAPPGPDIRGNLYAYTRTGNTTVALADVPARVYVPNSRSNTVDVIDPQTFRVLDHFSVGREPHHITPSWDLKLLYVDDTEGDSLVAIDPRSSEPVAVIPVPDPYNLYFTPDGSKAVVVAERYRRLDFRDPQSWNLIKSVPIPWAGVDHLDFSADGRFLLASTEYTGFVVKIDTGSMALLGAIPVGGLPVDVKLAPNGSVFFVTNQGLGGVSVVDPVAMRAVAFIPTGKGAHGLQVSRDARWLYVSNRLAGTISVIDLSTRQVDTTWTVGGSPDMLQLSPDGRQLWISNRFHGSVSVIDTETGRAVQTISVGAEPHGLTYFPQPGRFSIGHNGVYR